MRSINMFLVCVRLIMNRKIEALTKKENAKICNLLDQSRERYGHIKDIKVLHPHMVHPEPANN